MNYNFISILLDFFITIIAYLIIPFILFYKAKKEYDKKEKKKILILNSIIIAIVFIIIRAISNDVQPVRTFAPALLYYYINKLIWIKHSNKNIKRNKQDNSWKGFCTFIGIVLLIIQIIALLFNNYNCRISSYEDNCNLARLFGIDSGLLYGIGKNILLVLSIVFLYLEDKKINNIIRIIFLTIIIIAILIILGY